MEQNGVDDAFPGHSCHVAELSASLDQHYNVFQLRNISPGFPPFQRFAGLQALEAMCGAALFWRSLLSRGQIYDK